MVGASTHVMDETPVGKAFEMSHKGIMVRTNLEFCVLFIAVNVLVVALSLGSQLPTQMHALCHLHYIKYDITGVIQCRQF